LRKIFYELKIRLKRSKGIKKRRYLHHAADVYDPGRESARKAQENVREADCNEENENLNENC
jgi:hypothetical protein